MSDSENDHEEGSQDGTPSVRPPPELGGDQSGFVQYFRRLPPSGSGTVRIFDR